jgi:hypothetical protein
VYWQVAARVRPVVGAPDESAEPTVQAPVLKVFGAEPRECSQRPPTRLAFACPAEHIPLAIVPIAVGLDRTNMAIIEAKRSGVE